MRKDQDFRLYCEQCIDRQLLAVIDKEREGCECDPDRHFYLETRFTADRSQPGSRWQRKGPSTDEITARAAYLALGEMPGVDARIVRLDWDPDGDEDSMPLTTVVVESTGAT